MGKRAVIYGASGFIGGGLAGLLAGEGYEVVGVSRKGAGNMSGVTRWVKPEDVDFQGCDVVVNLAGAPIDQRWTEARKREFHESRVGVTEDIVERIAALPEGGRPGVLLNGSAVGIYGNRGDEILGEGSPHGTGYLADLCAEWEAAAGKAELLGVRVVMFRIGVVLGKGGQAYEKLMRVFKAGIGGRLGDGSQWMPWIHVDDLRRAMVFSILSEGIRGAVNGTAPVPERNSDLTRKLARAVGRWVFLPVPGFALRLVLGDFAGVLLASQRAVPAKLEKAGFAFRFRTLEDAFADLTA
ncbi:TIGR01777 family protein [Akkermansiaceae bacterium]|nr:TIGR01777 family protein [Akkermansiaceae bacterium]